MWTHPFVLLAPALLALLPRTLGMTCMGCVELDELNFDKTVVRFPYAVVKFDIAFPYGDKHEAFAELSTAAHAVTEDLLVATVGIKDYGELENKELGRRFKVDEKDFPVIFLFRGSLEHPIRFPGHLDVTVKNLKDFVSKHSTLYLGPEGCLKAFNALAKDYANKDDAEQQRMIALAETLLQPLQTEAEQSSGQTYVTFMKQIQDKGYAFVEEESKRLMRLKAGKVHQDKKQEIVRKLNILQVFRVGRLKKAPPKEAAAHETEEQSEETPRVSDRTKEEL